MVPESWHTRQRSTHAKQVGRPGAVNRKLLVGGALVEASALLLTFDASNSRVVSATHMALSALAHAGVWRADIVEMKMESLFHIAVCYL